MASCLHHEHVEPPEPIAQGKILFKNVNVFDGENEALMMEQDVLVVKNLIAKIVPTGSETLESDVTLDCEGNKTLMPGMIDCHWHSLLAITPMKTLLESDFGYMTILAAKASKDALLRGFTTCRDAGGNVFGVKKATDEGLIEGPRLYPAGPLICQTAGHFDFRSYTAVPTNPCEPLDYMQRVGACLVADGQAEVLKRTREALRMGATQIKIAGGGGVSSIYDPIDVQEFTEEEVKAAVAAASAWNTYVCAHIFTDKAIRMCVEAGVTSIEHGLFATKETLQLMKEKGAWLSFQPVMNDEDAIPFPPGSEQQKKFEFVTEQTYNCARKCKEVGVNMAWGTDVLFDPQLAAKQGKLVAKMTKLGFSPYETLKMVTSNNAKLCKMCNERDPYPHEFGVVKVGAYADLLVVEGNPLDDISLVANAEENFSAIMKDGKLHKNLFK